MTGRELGQQQAHSLPAVKYYHPLQAGLTKREWMAGVALAGVLANNIEGIDHIADPNLALRCVDVLLDELAKEQV